MGPARADWPENQPTWVLKVMRTFARMSRSSGITGVAAASAASFSRAHTERCVLTSARPVVAGWPRNVDVECVGVAEAATWPRLVGRSVELDRRQHRALAGRPRVTHEQPSIHARAAERDGGRPH